MTDRCGLRISKYAATLECAFDAKYCSYPLSNFLSSTTYRILMLEQKYCGQLIIVLVFTKLTELNFVSNATESGHRLHIELTSKTNPEVALLEVL